MSLKNYSTNLVKFTGLVLVGLASWVSIWIVRTVWRTLLGVNPQLAVALITAVTTILVATITVMLGRYYERKHQIAAQFRTEKIKIYDEFLAELFKVFHQGTDASDADRSKFLNDWQRKLVLWGGSSVLLTYFNWMDRLKQGNPDAQTMFLMDDFFRALRSDIGQSSTGLERGAFAHLVLRYPKFFLEQAHRNPAITLAELAILEKERFGSDKT
jgi:hypothetical protein